MILENQVSSPFAAKVRQLRQVIQAGQMEGPEKLFGGPVQDDRGFVLHTPDAKFNSMLTISNDVAFTTSRDILEAIASGEGPEKMLVSIGYAGWSAGQLEQEISHNGWLTVSADPSIIFDLPISQRYTAAIKLLGFDPNKLTYEVGHA